MGTFDCMGYFLLYVPAYAVIITNNRLVLRLLSLERYTMPPVLVVPPDAHPVCAVIV